MTVLLQRPSTVLALALLPRVPHNIPRVIVSSVFFFGRRVGCNNGAACDFCHLPHKDGKHNRPNRSRRMHLHKALRSLKEKMGSDAADLLSNPEWQNHCIQQLPGFVTKKHTMEREGCEGAFKSCQDDSNFAVCAKLANSDKKGIVHKLCIAPDMLSVHQCRSGFVGGHFPKADCNDKHIGYHGVCFERSHCAGASLFCNLQGMVVKRDMTQAQVM